jgi:DNA processing protein
MTTNPSRDLQIAYALLPFLTPARLRLMRERIGSPREICETPPRRIASILNVTDEQARLVKNPLHLPAIRDTVSRWRETTTTIEDPGYPSLLLEISDPPSALFVEGDLDLLSRPMVGIVGSRRASTYGIAVARKLASELSAAGITVVSGFARGIDIAAHRAAIEHRGSTVAVLGTGLDVPYPRGHGKDRRRLRESGLLVTEFPPGRPPLAQNFPVRNRIIAGLSLGVVVVEATARSGSLITARMAAEQNREVFAVPGPLFSAASEGPNRLIQYGAKLVHDIDDILEELLLPDLGPRPPRAEAPQVPPSLKSILDRLEVATPTHIDTLSTVLDQPVNLLAAHLLELELDGHIRSLPGGVYVLSEGS